MSFFFVYFETKNSTSSQYEGFKEVGKFKIPSEIFAGEKRVIIDNKVYTGGIISDYSKICANDFIIKKKIDLQNKLFNFIKERQKNNSIESHIVGCIENGEEFLTIKLLAEASLIELPGLMSYENFKNGCGYTINLST